MIKPETIQTIIETAQIEEVVGDFIQLKKRGVNHIGLCPFHNEKTPSFTVSPSKGIYKCFGCGKAGNSVGFIMEHEHYSFPEALKYLARKYGIEVDEEEMTPEMKQELDERESMFVLNHFVGKYFQDNLFHSEHGKAVALSYLKQRDFRESTMEKFQLGYALDQWEDYSKYALNNGYQKQVLVETGLSIERENRLIDRFKGRIIFPIHNLTGKIIGFGGRVMSSEKSTAKYVNSPESPIYNKSKVLYGIYFARNEIVKKDNCYLVEGYTDVISLHQAGYENVVASSGTSLTVDQIKLIKRFTPNITILYDGDPAGIKASFRGIDLILEQGMNVKIVLFPEGEDPDSYVRAHRKAEVDTFLEKEAFDFITFKTRLLLDETLGDPSARAKLIKEIVQTIAHIPDGINRSVYIRECSAVMEVPEQTLVNELNRLIRNKFRNRSDTPDLPYEKEHPQRGLADQAKVDPHDISYHENHLMRLLLLYGGEMISMPGEDETSEDIPVKISDYILDDLDNDQIKFENTLYQEILNEMIQARKEEKKLDLSFFTNHPRPKIAETVIELVHSPHHLSENWKRNKIFVKAETDQLKTMVITTLLPLKSKLISKQLKSIADRLKVADNEAEQFVLMQQYFELKKLVSIIDSELNRPFNY